MNQRADVAAFLGEKEHGDDMEQHRGCKFVISYSAEICGKGQGTSAAAPTYL